MIASTTTELSFAISDSVASQALTHRPRRLSSERARGMEILGHAIEYLSDEFILGGDPNNNFRNRLDAVELLMALHREIYLDAPERCTLLDRVRLTFAQLMA